MVFANSVGLNLMDVRKEVSFPILRENLISETHEVHAGKDSIVRQDSMETLGIISKRRGVLDYGTIMDWMVEEFDGSGISYKLNESVIDKKGNLFQQYLFDMDMDNPDGESISPMAVIKASYVQKPLEISFGTYRFVCSNGAIVGNTLQQIQVSGREISDLLSHSIRDDIRFSLDNMNRVSKKYEQLKNESFKDYLDRIITSTSVPTGLKKSSLYKLSEDGTLILTLEEDNLKITGNDFKTKNPDTLYQIHHDKDAWSFYNDLTELSTHRSRSVNSRTANHRAISEVFAI